MLHIFLEIKTFQVTFFLNWDSNGFDQSFEDVIRVEATAISTPLERVPLYNLQSGKEPIMLLKSSQAISISDLFNVDTPTMNSLIRLLPTSSVLEL